MTAAITTAATTTINNQQHPALNGRHSFHLTSGRSKKKKKTTPTKMNFGICHSQTRHSLFLVVKPVVRS